uniref:NAD-dependent protein deacylase n=1 Tax=Trypanosoma congolense (strain IL3000) TaxID=1068625 RepID=G0URT3_TRYCI|nr:putative NAD dependent deacetylase [Trypanosoma congolense IL3000]
MADRLAAFIERCGSRRCVVLTGAGCSTESGLPDYRGPSGLYRRANFTPLTWRAFLSSSDNQKRYWARSMFGYDAVSGVSCNATHVGLYRLCRAGVVGQLLTQNIDGLHHLAYHGGVGSRAAEAHTKYVNSDYGVIELHGNIHNVCCLKCGNVSSRQLLQQRLCEANRQLYQDYQAEFTEVRPDGDYDVPERITRAMQLVFCEHCGGLLKPHVVLFGENVPSERVTVAISAVREASSLICLGTSLQVFSGYRFVLAARESSVPVAIVTSGKTRADGLEDLRIDTHSTANTMRGVVKHLLGCDLGWPDHPPATPLLRSGLVNTVD